MIPFAHGISPLAGWLIAGAGVLVIGLAKSGFGGGLGIVGVVGFALAFGAQKGNAILLPILIVSDVFSVYYHFGTWNRQILKVMAPGTLLGILMGALILLALVRPRVDPAAPVSRFAGAAPGSVGMTMRSASRSQSGKTRRREDTKDVWEQHQVASGQSNKDLAVNETGLKTPRSVADGSRETGRRVAGANAAARVPARSARDKTTSALDLITGMISILYVLLDQVRVRYAPHWHWQATYKTGLVAGLAAGTVSTLANAAGPISAIYFLGQGLPRATFIGTTVLYFLATNTVKLIPYTLIPGLIDWHSLLIGLYFLPLVPVGTGLGKWLSHRINDHVFRNLMLGIVLLTGIQLCWESLTGQSVVQLLLGR